MFYRGFHFHPLVKKLLKEGAMDFMVSVFISLERPVVE